MLESILGQPDSTKVRTTRIPVAPPENWISIGVFPVDSGQDPAVGSGSVKPPELGLRPFQMGPFINTPVR